MARFNIGLLWPVEGDLHEMFVNVTGNCIHEPALRRGNPERWTEGLFALEDIEVRDRNDMRLVSELEDKLKNNDAFMRAIEERIR